MIEQLLESWELKTLDYKESRSDEWYHALISIDDLPNVFSISNLKIYAWYRCKLIDSDGIETHHH